MIVKKSNYTKNVINHWMTSEKLNNRGLKLYGNYDQGMIRLYYYENINHFSL